jgi:hypothetical protein
MKLIKILIIISILTLLSSCFAASPNRWNKPGISEYQTKLDYEECEMYGMAHSNMNPFMALDLTKRCMQNKGYRTK